MYSDVQIQVAKEIVIALIQSGGVNSTHTFFPKQGSESMSTESFEAIWNRIVKTVSAGGQ